MDSGFTEIYQFKISLQAIKPRIWRQIQVPSSYSFWDLHVAIQDAMGWMDDHLHVFRVPHPSSTEVVLIGGPDEYEPQGLPRWEVAISGYFSMDNNFAEYEYDFGDNWQHDVVLEKTLPRDTDVEYPRCLAGERACPLEDCGGVVGYQELLEAILNPNHEEHKRMLEWVDGAFDPESFDPKQVSFDDPDERWERAFSGAGD